MFSGSVFDSFLKSHLQKAVRRKQPRAAIYTADLLLEMSPVQLLRRLPIIMVEDTFLHQCFSTLVWLMCAVSSSAKVGSSIFYLHEVQKQWILGVVHHMASCEYKEIISHRYWTYDKNFSRLIPTIHQIEEENPDIFNLIYSLETRRVYGGLKGDNGMLKAYQHYYIDRFAGRNQLNEDKSNVFRRMFYKDIRPILCKRTPFAQHEWIYAGYDFHCSPSILTRLEEKFEEYDKDEFKSCIWYCSSSRNHHVSVKIQKDGQYHPVVGEKTPQHLTDLWKKIRKFVRGKAWGYVQRMLEDLNMLYPDWVQYTPLPEKTLSSENKDDGENDKSQGEQGKDLVSDVHIVI
jgi:hypothetical protein